MSAKAIDKAGNFLGNSTEFNVGSIVPPEITEYPNELGTRELFVARGKTYSNSEVTLWLQKADQAPTRYISPSDSDGHFTLVIEEGLSSGAYKLWAEVTDNRGAKSDPSAKVTIIVKQSLFIQIGESAIGLLSVLIPLIALLILFMLLLWYSWYKFKVTRGRIRKEVSEAENALHKAFDMLREDIKEQIQHIEKAKTMRDLTEEEHRIIQQFKKHLDTAEKFISKEVEDIEKEIS